MYHIEQFASTAQGDQHITSEWPVGDGEVTNSVPEQGAVVHSTVKLEGDTITFTGDVTVQGQTVATQNGREFLSPDGKTMTQIVDMQPAVGDATATHIRMTMVYRKKR